MSRRYLIVKGLSGNPGRKMRGVKPERLEEQKYVTGDQLHDLLAAVKSDSDNQQRHRDHCALFLGFYLALRRGEAAILSREHFRHLGRGVIYVTRLKKRDGPTEMRLPVIEPQVVEYAKEYLGSMKEGRMWLFPAWGAPERHVSPWTMGVIFNTYAQKSGLDPEYSWHSLRHGRGLQLWSLFRDLKVVQDFLGHSNMTTASIYVHLDPAAREDREKALGKAFGRAGRG